MKKLLFAIAIGAALAWFLDPDAGSRRREALRGKLDGLTGSRSGSTPASSPTSSIRPVGGFNDGDHGTTTAAGVVAPSVASVP